MKKILLLLTLSTLLACCNKDETLAPPQTPVSQLPPATQTGANTVGCLLDGEVFKPDNRQNSTNCFYQFVNSKYYFTVAFRKSDKNNNLLGIDVGTNAKEIFEGETYDLITFLPNNASATFIFNLTQNFTDNIHKGELKITKLDKINFIVSGTFWFDVIDSNGVIHQIREGRFDMRYTT